MKVALSVAKLASKYYNQNLIILKKTQILKVHQAERGDGGGEQIEVHVGGIADEQDEETFTVLTDEQAVCL